MSRAFLLFFVYVCLALESTLEGPVDLRVDALVQPGAKVYIEVIFMLQQM